MGYFVTKSVKRRMHKLHIKEKWEAVEREKPKPLKIEQLEGVVFIWCIGISLSVVVAMLEILHVRSKPRSYAYRYAHSSSSHAQWMQFHTSDGESAGRGEYQW